MSQTLSASKVVAMRAYKIASTETRSTLEDLFGKQNLSGSITELVSDFNDILAFAGKTMDQVVSPTDTPDEAAYKKIKLIAEVYNEGTVLDPNDTNQYKYYPWFEITPGSGFGLSGDVYGYWHTLSAVGVRLCFKNASLAIDAGKKFTAIYADYHIK